MKSPQKSPASARLLAVAISPALFIVPAIQAQTTVTTGRVFTQVAEAPTASTQFVTVSGAGTINPSGKTGSGFFHGSGQIGSFESFAGYSTVQTFPTSLNNLGTAKALNFTGTGSSDVLFSASGGTGTSVATNGTYATSTGNAIRLQVPVATTFTFTVSFGDLELDPVNTTQYFFNPNQGVTAVGFTLSGLYSRLVDTTATVNFYSAGASLLSSQALNGTVEGSSGSTSVTTADRWAFVGWQNTSGIVANNISYLTVSFTTWASGGDLQLALDDFGYSTTAIPEPSTAVALAGAGALGLALGGRRRRR